MHKILILSVMLGFAAVGTEAQEASSKQEAAVARSNDGKKLFGTAEAMRIARVSSPRISPDGTRVAYLGGPDADGQGCRSHPRKGPEQPGKFVTQLWVVSPLRGRPVRRGNSRAARKAFRMRSGRPTGKFWPLRWTRAMRKTRSRKSGSCTRTAARLGKLRNTSPAWEAMNFRPTARRFFS